MKNERPLGITLLGYINLIAAILLLIFVLFEFNSNIPNMNNPFLLSTTIISASVQLIIFSVISLIISYGYLKLAKWGYWSTMIYLIGFLAIYKAPDIGSFICNAILTILVVIYTYRKRSYFLNKNCSM